MSLPPINAAEWLDLIQSAPDREARVRMVQALIDESRRKTRSEAEGIMRDTMNRIGNL